MARIALKERGAAHGEEAESQVIGALCDKIFSLRLWLFVSFVARVCLLAESQKLPNGN
jgi:hypothetical protein